MGPTVGLLGFAMALAVAPLAAAGPADFFKGKQLTLLINFSTGSPTDVEARLFARHLGGLIAGHPQIRTRNMAGGNGGTDVANYLGLKAPPDGETMGYFSAIGWAQAFKPIKDKGLRVALGEFGLVAIRAGTSIAYLRTDVAPGIKQPVDIMRTRGFIVAGLRATSPVDLRQRLVLDMLRVRYSYVTGYRLAAKAWEAVGHGEVHYLTEFHSSFRAGTAIALFYYPFDDGTEIRGWPQISRDLHIPPFHQFHAKVKGRPPAGLRWKAFRQVNRAAAMVGRAILLPPGSPRAALAALRKAVGELNKDAEYARDAGKTVGFVPRFQVGSAASKLLAAGTRFTPDVIAFLKHYIAKIAQNRP